MDRYKLKERLTQLRIDIAVGEKQIARQRNIIFTIEPEAMPRQPALCWQS